MTSFRRYAVAACALLLGACTMTTVPDNQDASDDTAMTSPYLQFTRADWLAHYHASPMPTATCDEELPAGLEDEGVQVYEMGESHYVVRILCGVHAYQNSFVFYNLSVGPQGEGEPIEMAFDAFDPDGNRRSEYVVTDAQYDPESGTLTTLAKARGAGDCGSAATYVWREDIGGFFNLVEYRQKNECDGEAGEWPVIFSGDNTNAAEGQMMEDDAMMQ